MGFLTDKQVEQYAALLEQRIKEIKGDWETPWFHTGTGAPQNLDGRPYTRVNAFMLGVLSSMRQYELPVYVTFNRAKQEDICINSGEKGTLVAYKGSSIKHRETGKYISEKEFRELSKEKQEEYSYRVISRVTPVFNLDQTNIRESRPELWEKIKNRINTVIRDIATNKNFLSEPLENITREDQWIIPILHSPTPKAYYSPGQQIIHLPNRDMFKSNEDYYSTALHEMAHSTERPLNREIDNYAREELVAELTSAITGLQYNLPRHIEENNAKYLKAWLENMREDPSFLRKILEDVQKSSNFMLDEIEKKHQMQIKEKETVKDKEHKAAEEKSRKEKAAKTTEERVSKENQQERKEPLRENIIPLLAMYAQTRLMTTVYLSTAATIKDEKMRELIDSREQVGQAPERNMIEDRIRERIKELASEQGIFIPQYPSYKERETIIRNYISSNSQSTRNSIMTGDFNRDTSIHIVKPATPQLLEQLQKDGVDISQPDPGIVEYDAKFRYREGVTVESHPDNLKALDEMDVETTKLPNGRYFIPLSDKNIGKLLVSNIPLTAAYGIGTLPKLRPETLQKHLEENTNLTSTDVLQLQEGTPVSKDIESGKIYFIDKQLNQLREISQSDLHIPEQLGSITLNKENQENLRQNKEFEFFDKEQHVYHRLRLDPERENNVSIEYKTLKTEKYKPAPTVTSPDADKKEYVAIKGAKGIEDIWGRGGVNLERESFLKKYNVQEEYREFVKLQAAGEPGKSLQQNEQIKAILSRQEHQNNIRLSR